MVSPIRAMREKMKAARKSAGESPAFIDAAATTTDSLELRLMELQADLKTLKPLERIEDKIEHKRSVLMPKYRPLAEAYLESGATYANPIFSEVVLWLFDIGELDTFMAWVDIAIEKEIPTPERINRTWQTFCADSIHQWATAQMKAGHSIEPYVSQVIAKLEDANGWRLHEKVQSKLYKLAGQALLRGEDGSIKATHVGDVETLEKAKALLKKADELSNNAQVSDLLNNRIPARIKALKEGTNL